MVDLKHYMISATLWITLAGCAGCGREVNVREISHDTTPPIVALTNPADGATSFAVNSAITVTFNEAMDASTINTTTFTLSGGVTGTVTYDEVNMIATFTPSPSLDFSTAYTATVTTGVKDAAGNAMAANYTWIFTTGTAPDTTPPTVSSTSPANSATGVVINTTITATFSETMTASTVNTATYSLSNGVTGTVTYTGTTATFTPSSNLAYSTTYTATITTGVKDAAGNAMAGIYSWVFQTMPLSLIWEAPKTNTDGSPFTDLAGYKIYYGTSSSDYTVIMDVGIPTCQDVNSKTICSVSLNSLSLLPGTYFFVTSAYNIDGSESQLSNEISKVVN